VASAPAEAMNSPTATVSVALSFMGLSPVVTRSAVRRSSEANVGVGVAGLDTHRLPACIYLRW
jgi:hypothetical protein